MAVLKQKRTTSKAEFINTAAQIYVETLNFLSRLSARYSRLVAEPVAKLAGEVLDHAEKANSIFPSDAQRIELRKAHLLEARASLMALDVRLTLCYEVMNKNPEGCFTTSTGKTVDASKATEKLDKMAQSLGELIDKENELLKGAVKSLANGKDPKPDIGCVSDNRPVAVWAWSRSPYSNNNNNFCNVNNNGNYNNNNASWSAAVAPGFCFMRGQTE